MRNCEFHLVSFRFFFGRDEKILYIILFSFGGHGLLSGGGGPACRSDKRFAGVVYIEPECRSGIHGITTFYGIGLCFFLSVEGVAEDVDKAYYIRTRVPLLADCPHVRPQHRGEGGLLFV